MNIFKKIIFTMLRHTFNISLLVLSVCLVYRFTGMAYELGKGASTFITPEEKSAREVTVTIPAGATAQTVAEILKKAELTNSTAWFRIQSRLDGIDSLYKAGTYTLNTNMDDEEVMEILTKGVSNEEMLTITIPEGYTVSQICSLLKENGLCDEQQFREAMNSGNFAYSFIDDIPERNTRLEGYLFPDTYFIYKDATPEEIISKMLTRFEDVYNEEAENAATQLSMDEVITRASIIEAEIKIPSERPLCASVIQNRLDAGISLQMDATIQYALGERKKRLFIKDLEVESPYNTYKYPGLPIGPIGNPGRDSIRAALNPAKTDYLYYVVNDLEAGTHEFVTTYDEFLTAKGKYQDIVDQL